MGGESGDNPSQQSSLWSWIPLQGQREESLTPIHATEPNKPSTCPVLPVALAVGCRFFMPASVSSLATKEGAIPCVIVLLGTWIRGNSLWISC